MLRKFLIVFVLLLLLITGFAGWLLTTQSGLKWGVAQAQKWVPELHIGQIEGQLLDSVRIQQLVYQPDDATGVAIDELELQWTPSALLTALVYVDRLHIEGITVNMIESTDTDSSEGAEKTAFPEIRLPVDIQLNDVLVSNVKLLQNEQVTPIFQSLTAKIEAKNSDVRIQQLELVREDLDLSLSGEVGLALPYSISLDYAAQVQHVVPSEMVFAGHIGGNTDKLVIQQQVTAPFKADLVVNLNDVLANLKWSLQLDADIIQLATLVEGQQTQISQLQLLAEGDLQQVSAELQGNVKEPEFPVLAIKANADSDNFLLWQVDLQANLSDRQFVRVQGEINTAEQLSVDARLSWQQLQWPLDVSQPDYFSESGDVLVKGGMNDFRVTLTAGINVQQQAATISAEANGTEQSVNLTKLLINGFGGKLEAKGHANWQAEPMQYQFDADWNNVMLPESLTGMAIALQSGTINLLGSPQALALDAQTSLTLDGIAASINMSGTGEYAQGFDDMNLRIQLADGHLAYKGEVLWAGYALASGRLTLDKLNPGVVVSEWPGQLSGQLDVLVNHDEAAEVEAKVDNMAITGSLRQRPLSLTGAARYSAKFVELKQLVLKSGRSSLQANGSIKDEKLAISFDLNSPDLTDFHPEIKGQLLVNGQTRGTISEPAVDVNISGTSLVYQDFSVAKIEGRAALGLAATADLNTQLDIQTITLPQLVINHVKLALNGKQTDHQMSVEMQSEALDLSVNAAGSLQNKQWIGHINQFNFSNQYAGDWRLTKQGQIRVSDSIQELPKHCWSSTNGELCLSGEQQNKQWQTAGSFNRVPLSLFEGFVEQISQLKGELRGNFSITAPADKPISGQGEIYLDKAYLKLDQDTLTQKDSIALNNTALLFRTDAEQTNISFNLEPDLDGVSAIEAQLQTVGVSSLLESVEDAPVQGRIKAAMNDLALLKITHPAIDGLKGAFNLDVTLAGTTGQPEIKGKAGLHNGEVVIIDAGVELKDISVNVDANLDTVNFDYHAKSGDGQLNGKGQFTLAEQLWELTTQLKADQFQVLNTPELLVIAEPDMAIQMTPTLTKVTGKVHIPYAELQPKRFNSTVSPSSDVVVIREDVTESPTGAVTQVDVTVTLGDKVKVMAMGFQGRLEGDLRVIGNTNEVLNGNGEIRIRDGSYVAYGQLLKVDNGKVRFAGNVENPDLDIKAVREGKGYKAGLHIEGPVSSPVATLFSDPTMDQDDILSYILLGKPIEEASATDAAILASAATGMGLQNGAMIEDRIADTFGLDEFSIGGDSAENAAVHVGKYLSPKLYMGYGMGIFDQVSTVELRYQLSKIWALRAESGTESGIDLLYTYEKNK